MLREPSVKVLAARLIASIQNALRKVA